MKMVKQIKNRLKYLGRKRKEKVHIVSYPKSGRTWLSIMVGEYLKRKYQLDVQNVLETHLFTDKLAELPIIQFSHGEDRTLWKKPEELERDKSRFKETKVLLLIRDPRDILVSAYFQKARRHQLVDPIRRKKLDKPVYNGSLKEFIYDSRGSIDTLIQYYNLWLENRHVPAGFDLLRYEDLKEDTPTCLKNVLNFIGIENPDEQIITEVVTFASFKNLQQLEKENYYNTFKFAPADERDLESFKVRKGKIGGYKDYLEKPEIDYLNQKIKTKLSPFLGY